jgi:hypothetical protein
VSTGSHFSHDLQRKVVRTLIAITLLVVVVGVPLVVLDDIRLNVAQQLGLAPGRDAEQLADAGDGATLVVLPLGDYDGVGRERYRYKAEFIGLPVDGGTKLTDIETDETLTVPLAELEFIASNADGSHVLFRGPAFDSGDEVAVLVDTESMTMESLPDGRATPAIEGDWETPTWAKTTGLCDRYSPEQRFVACFNRADAASYLAGDWQVDIQLYGDYQVVEPAYRGAGFLPMLGFAHQDTWIYLQNENGIWRVEVPESMQRKSR